MLLFTSIKPPATADDLSYLCDCLNSWVAAGFEPVAVNGPSEIEALRCLDLPVKFATLPTDGRPRIGAILAAIRDSRAPFAGIINADCKIEYRDVAAHLFSGLERRLVLAWRLDVGGGVGSAAMILGFDAFFFDTSVLPDDDCGFSIGDTWWDLWFPLACQEAGAVVETLQAPLLTHRRHPLNWNPRQFEACGHRFWKALRKPGKPRLGKLYTLATAIPERLHAMAQTVSIVGDEESDLILRRNGGAMIECSRSREAQPVAILLWLADHLPRGCLRWSAASTRVAGG